jgi:hypothetical protein
MEGLYVPYLSGSIYHSPLLLPSRQFKRLFYDHKFVQRKFAQNGVVVGRRLAPHTMSLTLAASIQNIDIGGSRGGGVDCGDNDESMMPSQSIPQRRPINISNSESFRTKRRTATASSSPATAASSCCCTSSEEDFLPVLKRGKSDETLSTTCSSIDVDALEDATPLSPSHRPPPRRRRPRATLQRRGVHFDDSSLATVVGHVAHRSDLTSFEKDALYWSPTDLRLIRQDAKAISKYYRSPNGRRAMYELDRVYTWTMTNSNTSTAAITNPVDATADDDEEDFLTESYWDEFLYNETNQMDRYAVPLLWHWSGCRRGASGANGAVSVDEEAGRGLERYCSIRQRLERTQFTNHVRQTVIALHQQLKQSNDHHGNNHSTYDDRVACRVAAAYRLSARPAVLFARILGHADELAAEQAFELSPSSSWTVTTPHMTCATTTSTNLSHPLPKQVETPLRFNDPLPQSLEPTPLHPSFWGSSTDYSTNTGRENTISPITVPY